MDAEAIKLLSQLPLIGVVVWLLFRTFGSRLDANEKATLASADEVRAMGKTLTRIAERLRVEEVEPTRRQP